jgi:hypothetical protein
MDFLTHTVGQLMRVTDRHSVDEDWKGVRWAEVGDVGILRHIRDDDAYARYQVYFARTGAWGFYSIVELEDNFGPVGDDLQSETRIAEMIDAIRKHAKANYERDGWDYIVETYEPSELREIIVNTGATTDEVAIAEVGRIAKLLDDNRREVQATRW